MKVTKHKMVAISDHCMSTSGVGCQSRWLFDGLIKTGHWTIRQLGAAVKHANYDTIKVNDDLIIKPIDGFGTPDLIRFVIATERPDVLFLMSDPRFHLGTVSMEDEIHQVCPIVWNSIWDAPPDPEFNRVIYDSVDLINCLNWPHYEFCKARWPDKSHFVPHGLPPELFRPLPEHEQQKYRHQLLNGRCDDHFVGLWVNRNARRKQPGDLLYAWKLFLDELEKKHGHRKATLVMHTDPLDNEGPNLFSVIDMLGIRDNVFFSTSRFEFEQMNVLHNIADFGICLSSAEGHGLGTHESMQCGKPIVALRSGGGQTRQVVDHRDGSVYGVALEPDMKSLAGSQQCPYIWDYYVKHETVCDGLMELYDMGPEKRREIGSRAREYVLSEFSLQKTVDLWDQTMCDLIERWKRDRKSVYRPWEARVI